MLELLIGTALCGAFAATLWGYIEYCKKKFYKGKDPSSLSNTFYHTGWAFRVLLIGLPLMLLYPVLLSNGMFVDGSWVYSAPDLWTGWGKFIFALAMGGIMSVALLADFKNKNEDWPHVAGASLVAGGGAFAGCLMRPDVWWLALVIWFGWLGYYLVKNKRNNKAGNPDAWGWYIEAVAFYAVAMCLAIFPWINYLF